MGESPDALAERLDYHEFVELLAHYGLRDPERKLEKEVNYREAYDEIMRERAQRAKTPSS